MTGPKKNRKEDMERFEKIFNDNEYWPNTVKSNFDKNFWFYAVTIEPTEESMKDDEYCNHGFSQTGLSEDFGILLKKSGFMIISTNVTLHQQNHSLVGWGYSRNSKMKELYTKLNLQIVREDEWSKYAAKNWRASHR